MLVYQVTLSTLTIHSPQMSYSSRGHRSTRRSTRLQVQLRHGAAALGPEPEHCHVGAHHAAEDRLGIPNASE